MSLGVSGKYRLERRLGGGGMAEVFEGAAVGAEGFSRKVAIKRVLPGYSDNAGFARMFVAEAQISAQLVHPNIVSVLDFDRDADGRLFLVMELVDGVDLDALLATGLLPFPVVIFIVAEILRGLGFAHDLPTGSAVRGVVHRDVSPHNVLLSWAGAVKVSDFGIAKARAASEATASVFIKGKPAYMSPEQANGEPLDGRSDLFAVGVVLWEMLVGQRLFVADDTRATLAAVLFGQIRRPRAVRGDVPRDLERIAMKLLARELPARYATAEDALADLMRCSDAPRTGREALSEVLAERFPDVAPVRHSVAEARLRRDGGTTAPDAPGAGGAAGAAAAGAGAAAAAAIDSRPTLTAASDAAADPARVVPAAARSWLTVALIALALLIASAAGSFAVVSIVRRPAASADIGPPPSHAGATVTPQPRANTVQSARRGPEAHSGSLRVIAAPEIRIAVDGKPYGHAPLTIALDAGNHRVQLQNVEHHSDEVVPVTIVADQTTTLDRTAR